MNVFPYVIAVQWMLRAGGYQYCAISGDRHSSCGIGGSLVRGSTIGPERYLAYGGGRDLRDHHWHVVVHDRVQRPGATARAVGRLCFLRENTGIAGDRSASPCLLAPAETRQRRRGGACRAGGCLCGGRSWRAADVTLFLKASFARRRRILRCCNRPTGVVGLQHWRGR